MVSLILVLIRILFSLINLIDMLQNTRNEPGLHQHNKFTIKTSNHWLSYCPPLHAPSLPEPEVLGPRLLQSDGFSLSTNNWATRIVTNGATNGQFDRQNNQNEFTSSDPWSACRDQVSEVNRHLFSTLQWFPCVILPAGFTSVTRRRSHNLITEQVLIQSSIGQGSKSKTENWILFFPMFGKRSLKTTSKRSSGCWKLTVKQ